MLRRLWWQLGCPMRAGSRRQSYLHGFWLELFLTLVLGVAAATAMIVVLGIRIRPVAALAARTQAENTVSRVVEKAVAQDLSLRSVGYSDFVSVQRTATGEITALTTDMAKINLLRGQLLECILETLEGVRVSDIHIPLGSLLDIDVLWAKGPELKVHSMAVGTVSAEFVSEFSGAGVNQTLHRIWLEVSIPLTLILPGDRVDTQVNTSLCVAETVIVGEVPQTYLEPAG